MQEIKSKKKKGKFTSNKVLYIVTGVLLVVLIVLIVLAVKGNGSKDKKNENVYSEDDASSKDNVFEENAYPEVSSLVNEYFVACAADDFTVLDQIVSDMGDDRESSD